MSLVAHLVRTSWQRSLAAGLCFTLLQNSDWAQQAGSSSQGGSTQQARSTVLSQAAIGPEKRSVPFVFRPYVAPEVPPARLTNSPRLQNLVKAGKLYLTLQDAIALALENNIDLEVARYNPLVQQSQLRRFQAGGALPGVPSSASQANSVTAGQGVAGSQQSAGVSGGNNSSTGTNSANATITQIGPVTPTFDPTLQETSTFSHLSNPQSNTTQAGVINLIRSRRAYSGVLQGGYELGGTVTLSYNNSYLNENAPSDLLNPVVSPSLNLRIQQPLLSGFGIALNTRNIEVQRIALGTAGLNFKTQVISTVATVVSTYYGLVADTEDVKAKQSAVDVARQFFENNQRQVQIGTMAPLDITSAEAQVASTSQDLTISQTNLLEQEVALKNLLSRRGLGDPIITNVQIVPLDRIVIPETDNLPPVAQLVKEAVLNRADLEAQRQSVTSAKVAALGTQNGVRPYLGLLAGTTQSGQAGTPRVVRQFTTNPDGTVSIVNQTSDPYFTGGNTTALGQVFRRDFPTENVGTYFNAVIRNQQNQADYGIEQLQLRQTELTTQKTMNQAAVDVANDVVALRQSRSRYDAAVRSRILAQELLDAEQKKFALGASTSFNIISQSRDLAAAQSTEIAAMVTYSNAKVQLDQVLGRTLQANNVSIVEAQTGQVARQSTLPPTAPAK